MSHDLLKLRRQNRGSNLRVFSQAVHKLFGMPEVVSQHVRELLMFLRQSGNGLANQWPALLSPELLPLVHSAPVVGRQASQGLEILRVL